MKHMIRWLWLVILTTITLTTIAQDPAENAIVLQMTDDGTPQLGQTILPGLSLHMAWNPVDATSWARVDDFGILRYAPIGNSEGVYSFSPYFQGFTTPSREENSLFVAEAEWSPNGQQMAFRVSSGDSSGGDGVWFWQPAIETATDPSYHLLRDCPPGCNLVNSRDTVEWKSLSIDWAPDNVAILVHLYLLEEERNAIGLVFASRDPESPQADIQPVTYRYEYGAWANDGDRLVVSGYDAEGNSVYGFLNRDGSNPQLNFASDIGLAYVSHAVHHPITGQVVMLGSTVDDNAPVALYDNNGTALSPLIGNQSPDVVEWSPNRDAVLVRAGIQTFIATLTGEVYDITDAVGDNLMVNWVKAGFPADTTLLNLPPAVQLEPTATPVTITISASGTSNTDNPSGSLPAPQTNFQPGQLLQVAVDSMTLYAEPIIGAEVVANLEQGEALVLIGGPLTDGVTVWWRIQTLDFVGWAEEHINGATQISP